MKSLVSLLALVSSLALASGCYRTSIQTGLPPAGPAIESRQWFTVGGLVELSDPTQAACPGGRIASAESRLSGVDILINVGLTALGAGVGAAACDADADAETYASCVSAAASLAPFLLGSRTVSYTCAAGPVALEPVPGARAAATSDAL